MAFKPEQNNLLTRCATSQRFNVNIERIDNWINHNFQESSKHNKALTRSSLQSPQAGMFANTYLRTSKHPKRTQTLKTAQVHVLNISIQTDRDEASLVVPLCVSGIQLAWSG